MDGCDQNLNFPCPVVYKHTLTGVMTLIATDDIEPLGCHYNNCPLYPYKGGACTDYEVCPPAAGFNTTFPIQKGTAVTYTFKMAAHQKFMDIVVRQSFTTTSQ